MNETISISQALIINIILEFGEDAISLEARQTLMKMMDEDLVEIYEQGKRDAIDSIFPEITDDYCGDSPLRKAALKIVFEQE